MAAGACSVGVETRAVDVQLLALSVDESVARGAGLAASFSVGLAVIDVASSAGAVEDEWRSAGKAVVVAIIRAAAQDDAASA